MSELVSIIIPCYNGEAYIDKAIQSVYEQECPAIELIVVDDGSTDASAEAILAWQDRFEEKGHIFKYIYQENKGLGGAINTGLKHVTGEFLSLLDADDEYLPGAVAERVAYLRDHPDVGVVRSNGWIEKGGNRRLFVTDEREKLCEDIFVPLLRGETNNWAGSYMVRTAQLFAFYPEREIYTSRYGQNLQLLMPLAYQKPCGFIDKTLMRYIQRDNSLSQTADAAIAKERSIENLAGYRDIRVYMLRQIVKDTAQVEQYMKHINGAYWRQMLYLANYYQDKILLRSAYEKLRDSECPRLDDRIVYFRAVYPPFALLLRVWRKLGIILGKSCDNS